MKTRSSGLVVCALILSLSPTISLAEGYYGGGPRVHHQGPGPSSYGQGGYHQSGYRSPPSHYQHYPSPYPYYRHHYHRYDWVAPVAILGATLGIMALSQPYYQPYYQPHYQPYYNPPPPRRMCRDSYRHYDRYGRYLYTEYVDRPCR